jgi:hypothetical protein
MTFETIQRWERDVAKSLASYDADEARWNRKQLRAAFAATQPDATLANKLSAAAFLFREAESESYRCPEAIGWTKRKDDLERYGDDVSVLFNVISTRYGDGGSAVHPDLQEIMEKIGPTLDSDPSAIAKKVPNPSRDLA